MTTGTPRLTDVQVEHFLGSLLRAGVILAAIVVLAGGVLYLRQFGNSTTDKRIFESEPADLRSVAGILRDAAALDSRGIIQFGLLLLIATPVARVAFSVVAFAIEGDKTYVAIALIVLCILIYSLSGGLLQERSRLVPTWRGAEPRRGGSGYNHITCFAYPSGAPDHSP